VPRDGLQREHRARNVDIEHPGIVLAGDLDNGGGREYGGVVDQNVDMPESVDRCGDRFVDAVLPGHVHFDGDRRVTEISGGGTGTRDVDIRNGDPRAFVDIGLGK